MRQCAGIAAFLAVLLPLVGCLEPDAPAPEGDVSTSVAAISVGGPTVVINEFQAGSSGWVELYNPGPTAVALGGWKVDDVANGGYAPKTIAAGTSIAAGASLVVTFAGFNTASADDVRLLDAAGVVVDSHGNNWAGSSISGLCFGRQPDGGAWAAAAIPCSRGASNGGGPTCTVGGPCDDGDACTTAEVYDASCQCGGGTAVSCDDENPCTSDACAPATGCAHAPVADGTPCRTGQVCQAGECVTDEAYVVSTGTSGAILLRGAVVTPDGVVSGELLVEHGVITCIGATCASPAQADAPTIIVTNGLILPGLIDAHNHILFDIFDETDWAPTKAYSNHNQWPNDARYKAMVDAKQYLNGEYGSPLDLGCEMDKYGELKGLLSGTTAIVGAANPGNKACYGSLARTIDQSSNELGYDRVQAATLFPSTSSADSVCRNIATGKTDSYIIHIGEGVDQTSRSEYTSLYTVPTVDGCLHVPQTAIVHGVSFGEGEFASMAGNGMSLVWSPASNVFLYGLGTDLTKTANIPLALSHGINVALAPDWSIGGSQNLLDELRFARRVGDTVWGGALSPKTLTDMATINPAKVLGLEQVIGSLAVGKKADLFVIPGSPGAPYDALLASRPQDIRLVMVNGVILYGDPQLQAAAPQAPGCEALDVCARSKFVCVARADGTATNKLGQTLAEIRGTLETALADYDAQNLTPWKFAPIAPLVKCDASAAGQ
jgi:cytosine/adenosine deaminase-related metal-dependent hydrolase